MRRPVRRSRCAASPSSANGGSSTAPSPTAWRKPATDSSPSPVYRRASGVAPAPRMRSNDCTRSSSEGSRRRPCCRPRTPLPCCSGHCSPLARSTCARLMAGTRSPQSSSISQLTSQPETIPSCYRRSRHAEFQPLSGRHDSGHHHLLIDTELPPLDSPIPNDFNHLHFGAGQTEADITLKPGTHTLQLLLGDKDHIPHNPPVMSPRIRIAVMEEGTVPKEAASPESTRRRTQ